MSFNNKRLRLKYLFKMFSSLLWFSKTQFEFMATEIRPILGASRKMLTIFDKALLNFIWERGKMKCCKYVANLQCCHNSCHVAKITRSCYWFVASLVLAQLLWKEGGVAGSLRFIINCDILCIPYKKITKKIWGPT